MLKLKLKKNELENWKLNESTEGDQANRHGDENFKNFACKLRPRYKKKQTADLRRVFPRYSRETVFFMFTKVLNCWLPAEQQVNSHHQIEFTISKLEIEVKFNI